MIFFYGSHVDPITSIHPTKDGSTYLVSTLDSHIRLMDCANGSVLNSFAGHKNDSYRTNACFGYGEASVVCGDEDGRVWSWDLVTVRFPCTINEFLYKLCSRASQQILIHPRRCIREQLLGQNIILTKKMSSSRPVRMVP